MCESPKCREKAIKRETATGCYPMQCYGTPDGAWIQDIREWDLQHQICTTGFVSHNLVHKSEFVPKNVCKVNDKKNMTELEFVHRI